MRRKWFISEVLPFIVRAVELYAKAVPEHTEEVRCIKQFLRVFYFVIKCVLTSPNYLCFEAEVSQQTSIFLKSASKIVKLAGD